jgi:hypothetical protein
VPSGVTLDQAISAIGQLQLQGRVFLVGEIVATGSAAEEVEVAVTEAADRQPLSQLPFPVVTRVIEGEPTEPWIEATPGSAGMSGGQEPAPDEHMAAV